MSVKVIFECDGCDSKADGVTHLKAEFRSLFGGRPSGLGAWTKTKPEDVRPPGWQAFDPYTGACYCPKCWEWILSKKDEDELEKKDASRR